MNRFDYTNLGGQPIDLDHLGKVQDTYLDGFKAIAELVGDNTIISGVDVSGASVNNGYVVINGELLRFVGGTVAQYVVIVETPTSLVFDDNSTHEVEFERYATCAPAGTLLFSSLVRLESLRNVWLPGDIKERLVDLAYEAANFDSNGYGINREKGWRILSKAYPTTAGKVFVNKDENQIEFDEVGKIGGEKEHTLSIGEMPKHRFGIRTGGDNKADWNTNNYLHGQNPDGATNTYYTDYIGNDEAHNNLQPYFVILKLIKI